MAETRRKFDRDFREGAVRLVRETGRPTLTCWPPIGRLGDFGLGRCRCQASGVQLLRGTVCG
jgi:hypothetical protein